MNYIKSLNIFYSLTGSYTHLLSGTTERRKHLRYSKFFDCFCKRCVDPTELGSEFTTLRCCQPNCSGYVRCQNPVDENNNPDFVCDKCHFVVSFI